MTRQFRLEKQSKNGHFLGNFSYCASISSLTNLTGPSQNFLSFCCKISFCFVLSLLQGCINVKAVILESSSSQFMALSITTKIQECSSLIKWKEGLWTPIRVDKSTWTFAPSAKEQPRRLIGSKEVTLLSKLIKRGIHFRKLRKEENYVKLKLIFTIVAVIRATQKFHFSRTISLIFTTAVYDLVHTRQNCLKIKSLT